MNEKETILVVRVKLAYAHARPLCSLLGAHTVARSRPAVPAAKVPSVMALAGSP